MRKFFHGLKEAAEDYISEQSSRATTAPNTPAAALAHRTFTYFYNTYNAQFQARSKSERTLGQQDHFGYVVWPVIITVHTLTETLPGKPLHDAIVSLGTYWNPDRHAFCAWKMFPGNEDIYYDDNAHAAQALISAYEATGKKKWLRQAKEILVDLIMPSAEKDGGVPWHLNNQNCRNACSTGPAAVAALRLCKIENDERLAAFAERTLRWLVSHLRDPEDGLIWDSLVIEGDGREDVNKMKWTYNTGFAIHGFTLLYEKTEEQEHLQMAVETANAALNPNGPLFDRCIPDPGRRMYSDSSFFLHHLVDGFLALSRHSMGDRLRNEIRRIASWGQDFMFDPVDGMYWRGSVPYTISEDTMRKFNERFGLQKGLEPNTQERDEDGHLCKTLIGNSAWVRILAAAENCPV
jgi:rhamnogalacturonyl hydrolase YesR